MRDALDRVLGGAIKAQTAGLPTGTTYRFHTQRLTANDPPVSTGLLLALGPGVDRPISAWEEMFLPLALREHARRVVLPGPNGTTVPLVAGERTLFESTAPEPPGAPPSWLPWYAAVGAVVGGLAGLLGAAAGGTERRWARVGLGLFSVLWGVLGGLVGVVLAVLWAFTDHAMAYRNENLFQLNPLLIALAVLVPLGLRGHRAGRWARGGGAVAARSFADGIRAPGAPGSGSGERADHRPGCCPSTWAWRRVLWLASRPGPAPGRPPLPGIRGTP